MTTFRAIEPSAIPLYSQVRERLRERIADGTYAPQTRLPSESGIGTLLGVSQELARLEGFGEAMSHKGHRIVNRVVKHAQVEASPAVAARLRVAPGALVTEIHRVRWLDHEPVSFEITYLPPTIGERLRGEKR